MPSISTTPTVHVPAVTTLQSDDGVVSTEERPHSGSASTMPQSRAGETTLPTELRILDAALGCGPTDAPFVDVTVISPISRTVIAEIWFDGHPFGRSEPDVLQPGTASTFGFFPAATGLYGTTVELRIATATQPATVLAAAQLSLTLPDDVLCG